MLLNLKNELNRKGISMKAFAEFLDVSEKTAYNKVTGATDFTYPEVRKISTLIFPEYNVEYLFSENIKGGKAS